jgi:hypothetical protein
MRELFRDAVRHLPLLAAGIDEQQVLLPVVEKPKIPLRIGGLIARERGRLQGGHWRRAAVAGPFNNDGTRPKGWMGRHEAMNAIERIGSDPAAVAKARRELSVVNGASSEGGFGKTGLTAIIRDFLE